MRVVASFLQTKNKISVERTAFKPNGIFGNCDLRACRHERQQKSRMELMFGISFLSQGLSGILPALLPRSRFNIPVIVSCQDRAATDTFLLNTLRHHLRYMFSNPRFNNNNFLTQFLLPLSSYLHEVREH